MIELKTCDVSTDEQETCIVYGRKDDKAEIYTNDPTVLTKISKVLNAEGSEWTLVKVYKTEDGIPSGYVFLCPKKLIKFVAKKKAVSEETRQALRDRMANIRNGQRDSESNDE